MKLFVGDHVIFDIQAFLKEQSFIDCDTLDFVKRNFPATINTVDMYSVILSSNNTGHCFRAAYSYLVPIRIQEKLE